MLGSSLKSCVGWSRPGAVGENELLPWWRWRCRCCCSSGRVLPSPATRWLVTWPVRCPWPQRRSHQPIIRKEDGYKRARPSPSASASPARYLLLFALLLYCWRLRVFLDARYSFSLDLELLCRSQLSLLGKIFDLERDKPNINDDMSFRMVFPGWVSQAKYLSFTKDDVCVWRGTLVDVWFGNDEQDVLWLANRDSRDPRYLPETELWHCLEERKEFKSFARHISRLIKGGESGKWLTFLAFFSLRLCLALLTGSSSISAAAASWNKHTSYIQLQTLPRFKYPFMEFSVFSGQKDGFSTLRRTKVNVVIITEEMSFITSCLSWGQEVTKPTWACCVCVCAESCSSSSGTESSLSDSVPDPRQKKKKKKNQNCFIGFQLNPLVNPAE